MIDFYKGQEANHDWIPGVVIAGLVAVLFTLFVVGVGTGYIKIEDTPERPCDYYKEYDIDQLPARCFAHFTTEVAK